MQYPKVFQSVGWLCAGIFVFSLQDLVVKSLSGVYPVHEFIVIRSVAAIPFLFVLVWRAGGLRATRSPRAGVLLLRSVLMLLAYTTYFLAFPVMKLVDINALYATVPLFVTALAGPLLGEKITVQRWAAVAVGFAGVMIMVRPGASVFEPSSLLPILSALAYAMAQILARRIGLAYSAAVMSFYQNFIYLSGAAILAAIVTGWGGEYSGHPSAEFMLRQWVVPGLYDLILIALCGPIAAIGMTMLGQAYRLTEVNFVTSFEYTALIWGTLWGYVVWREVPGVSSVIGAVLIVLAGLWLLKRANGQPAAVPEFSER